MSISQSTRYLLQFLRWLESAVFWRKECRYSGYHNMMHVRQVADWAKADLGKWKLATFGA
jgi:hypothetical protein